MIDQISADIDREISAIIAELAVSMSGPSPTASATTRISRAPSLHDRLIHDADFAERWCEAMEGLFWDREFEEVPVREWMRMAAKAERAVLAA
jgi:hypothetical protein